MILNVNRLIASGNKSLRHLGWLLFDMQMKEEVCMDDIHKIADILEHDVMNTIKEKYDDGYKDGRNNCLCRL